MEAVILAATKQSGYTSLPGPQFFLLSRNQPWDASCCSFETERWFGFIVISFIENLAPSSRQQVAAGGGGSDRGKAATAKKICVLGPPGIGLSGAQFGTSFVLRNGHSSFPLSWSDILGKTLIFSFSFGTWFPSLISF